jgi:hypothetical protein
LHPISSETASEHGATRKFRKGDIVSPAIWQGREPWGKGKDGSYHHANTLWKCTVEEDEWNGYAKCKTASGWEFLICACFLKLKVAIEKAEPFYVERDDNDGCYFVMRDDGCDHNVDTIVQAFYFQSDDYNAHYFTQVRAKELADEVCSKMNEEYRKEFV